VRRGDVLWVPLREQGDRPCIVFSNNAVRLFVTLLYITNTEQPAGYRGTIHVSELPSIGNFVSGYVVCDHPLVIRRTYVEERGAYICTIDEADICEIEDRFRWAMDL
jgi:mRNA-degrading endonuclease toxin of MazEF toxin-antitoxin module